MERIGRKALITLEVFLGATAVAGAIGLLTRMTSSDSWHLEDSFVRGYTIPGFALLGVGLIASAAAIMVMRREWLATAASAVAGVAIVVFEVVEISVVGFHWLQAVYLIVGAAMLLLSWQLREAVEVR